MLPSYTFNEQLKRFEPQDKACSYCLEKNESSGSDTNYFIPLFKEQDRTNVVVYRSVKYNKILIGVPRCKSCMTMHNFVKGTSKLYAWGAAILILIMSISLFGPIGIVAGIFASLLTGFLGSYLLENKMVEGRGILTLLDGAKTNAIIQEFVISGWSFSQPTA